MLRIKFFSILFFIFLLTSCSSSTSDNEELFEKIVILEMESELMVLVNEHRVCKGLNKLQLSSSAYKYATQHNSYMIDKGEISHDNFSERAIKLSAETNAFLIAENVAKEYEKATEAFNSWMNSPGHRKNLETNYTHTGISVMMDNRGDYYFTQMFYK